MEYLTKNHSWSLQIKIKKQPNKLEEVEFINVIVKILVLKMLKRRLTAKNTKI